MACMSKLDRIPTDEPQGLLIDDFNRAVVAIENQSLLSPGMPWLPSPEELIAQVRDNLERQIADIFAVPHSLIIAPPVASWINITFTITAPDSETGFQDKLLDLEFDAEFGPEPPSDFEMELECMDYEADSRNEPRPGTLEWKLWALDNGIEHGTSE